MRPWSNPRSGLGKKLVVSHITIGLQVSAIGLQKPFGSGRSLVGVSGVTVTLPTDGTCSITASQAGNSTYAPVTSVTQTFAVAGKLQTIAFRKPSGQTLGVTPFTLSATGDFRVGGGVYVQVDGRGHGIRCHRNAADGRHVFDHGEPGGQFDIPSGHSGHADVHRVGYDHLGPLSNQAPGTPPFALPGVTTSSGLPVTFAFKSPTVCTVKGVTVTLVGAGSAI